MNALPPNQRPHTASEVAEYSQDSEAFGRAVRDWQHELRKLSRRQDFVHAFTKRPKLLAEQLHDDDWRMRIWLRMSSMHAIASD